MMSEAGFDNSFTRPAERIQKTYLDEEVLADLSLDRASTSQLRLISEKAYMQGKKAIISRLQRGREEKCCPSFIIDHHLFAPIGTRNDRRKGKSSKRTYIGGVSTRRKLVRKSRSDHHHHRKKRHHLIGVFSRPTHRRWAGNAAETRPIACDKR